MSKQDWTIVILFAALIVITALNIDALLIN